MWRIKKSHFIDFYLYIPYSNNCLINVSISLYWSMARWSDSFLKALKLQNVTVGNGRFCSQVKKKKKIFFYHNTCKWGLKQPFLINKGLTIGLMNELVVNSCKLIEQLFSPKTVQIFPKHFIKGLFWVLSLAFFKISFLKPNKTTKLSKWK